MKKILFFILLAAFTFVSCEKESNELSEIERNLETLDTDTPVEHDRTSDILTLPS